MAQQQPKVPYLAKPCLADFAYVCHHLADDQRRQWVALEGREYDADMAAVELAGSAGPRWVLVEPMGSPLAVGGFRYLTPGVWQDWLITAEVAWGRYPYALTRACRQMVELMLETEAHRVQAVVLADRACVRKWYPLIGYEYEGTLRRYGAGGEDVVIYGRVRSDGSK